MFEICRRDFNIGTMAFTALRVTGRKPDETVSDLAVSHREIPVPEDVVHTIQIEQASEDPPPGNDIPNRQQLQVTQIVRDTKVGDWVKQLHDFTWQTCNSAPVLAPAKESKSNGAHGKGYNIL
jgi:hypothetical protein